MDYQTTQSLSGKKELIEKYKLSDKIVIGTVARLIDWKGYHYIIEAARELVKIYSNISFLFVGEGPQFEELNMMVQKYHLEEYIIFTGWVARDHIPSLYGIMDVYLHAAITEPFGFVIAEAMGNGVPLVTTKTGAAADALVHEKTAYFVREKSAEDIVKGVRWMLADQERKNKIAKQLPSLALAMYDVKDMVRKYVDVYQNINTDHPKQLS